MKKIKHFDISHFSLINIQISELVSIIGEQLVIIIIPVAYPGFFSRGVLKIFLADTAEKKSRATPRKRHLRRYFCCDMF